MLMHLSAIMSLKWETMEPMPSTTKSTGMTCLGCMQHIKVGEFLGSGKYSDTFAAVLDDDYYKRHYPQQFTASKQSPEYIIRIAGNYHDGVTNDRKLVKSERAWNISKRLSPHPSIPATMHYVKQTSNPLNDGRLQFVDDSKWKWAKKHMDGRLFKATNVSIDVTERVRPSVKHCEGVHGLLTVPPPMVRCFWRQLFETMSYVHSKGVSIRDTKLWNFMIREPGKIVLFDFNLGHIVDIGSKEYEYTRRMFNTLASGYRNMWRVRRGIAKMWRRYRR